MDQDLKNYLDQFRGEVNEKFKNMATKDDIKNMATKDDIKNMATKDDIDRLDKKVDGLMVYIEHIDSELSAHRHNSEIHSHAGIR